MRPLLACLMVLVPVIGIGGDYESSLIVQTGQLRESDLIVRTVTDLEDSRICLAFYVRTTGTSPAMSCYPAVPGFRSKIRQVGHFKDGDLVIRKLHDSVNRISCLVSYVSTEGTSPAIHCYQAKSGKSDSLERKSHVREGDLHVHQITDPGNNEVCLIAHVTTDGTSPALTCYGVRSAKDGRLDQTGFMKEGDLVVRKIRDVANNMQCMITYVSTKGTSPHIHCPMQASTAPVTAATTKPPTGRTVPPRVQPSFRTPAN